MKHGCKPCRHPHATVLHLCLCHIQCHRVPLSHFVHMGLAVCTPQLRLHDGHSHDYLPRKCTSADLIHLLYTADSAFQLGLSPSHTYSCRVQTHETHEKGNIQLGNLAHLYICTAFKFRNMEVLIIDSVMQKCNILLAIHIYTHTESHPHILSVQCAHQYILAIAQFWWILGIAK